MEKVLVYKDANGLVRQVELDICPIQAIQDLGDKIKNFLVSGGAPEPVSPVFALIRCK